MRNGLLPLSLSLTCHAARLYSKNAIWSEARASFLGGASYSARSKDEPGVDLRLLPDTTAPPLLPLSLALAQLPPDRITVEHLLDEARSFSSGPYEENNACVFFLRGLAAAPTGARALL